MEEGLYHRSLPQRANSGPLATSRQLLSGLRGALELLHRGTESRPVAARQRRLGLLDGRVPLRWKLEYRLHVRQMGSCGSTFLREAARRGRNIE